jgi:thioredoxin-related protein
MKTIIITFLAFWMAGRAGGSQWLTSVPQALDQAKAENKADLLDFTGSDWCGWCKKLVAETFSKPEFIDYADKYLVLVEVDFPRKTEQSAAVKEANKALKETYGVRGFPTLVDLAPDGTVLWKQTGYLAGGPAALIAKLDAVNPKPATPQPGPAVPKSVNLATVHSPAPVIQKSDDEPKLQGILWSSSHPSVLLNGKNCKPGDSVSGMHVLKITRDKVTVEWKGQTTELTMK